MKKVGFFEEKENEQSMMRLLSFLSFLVAVYIAIYSMMTKQPGTTIDSQTMTFFGFFMIGAFVPKALQKFAESRDVVKLSSKSIQSSETETQTKAA